MANRNETIIIDVQVTDVKQQLGETAKAINDLKEQNKQLKKSQKDGTADWAESTATIKANEAQIKLLTAAEKSLTGQLNANEVANRSYGKSNVELRAQVVALENAYNGLTDAQKDTAAGKALLQQQNELKASVKANAEELGNFQDSVGNYFGSFGKNLQSVNEFTKANGGLAGSFKAGEQAVLGFGKQLLALLANPIVAVIAAIAGAVMLLVNAMKQNGAATEKLNQILAPFKLLLSTITAVLGKLVSTILDGVLAFGNFANAILAVIPGMDKMAERNKEAIRLEREKQSLIRQGIVDKAQDAKEELRLADLRKRINQADKYSNEERLAFAREVDKAEKQMALDDANRANNNLKNFLKNMQLQGKAQKDYTIEELQQLTDLQAAKYNEQQAYYDKTRKTASREAALISEIESEKNAKIEADNKAAQERREETEKRRIENIGKYVDAELGRLNELARVAEEKRLLAQKAVDDAEAAFKSQSERLNAFAKRNSEVELQAFNDLQFAKRVLAENSIAEMANLDREALADEYRQRIANAEAAGRDTTLIEQAYSEERKRINQAETAAKIELAGQAMGALSAIFGEGSKAGKAFAAAQVAIDTYKGALSAFAAGMQLGPIAGPIVGGILAAGVVAKGSKAIKDIYAVKKGQTSVSAQAATPSTAAATSAAPTPATKGADLVLNSAQAGSLNGKIAAAQPQSGGIDYDLLAKSMSKQPAPVMVYSEFKTFEGKVTNFDEQTKI